MKSPYILKLVETKLGAYWTIDTDHTCKGEVEMTEYCQALDPTGSKLKVVDLDTDRPVGELVQEYFVPPTVNHPVFGPNSPADIQKMEAEVLIKENRLNHLDAIKVLNELVQGWALNTNDQEQLAKLVNKLVPKAIDILEQFNG